jgi:hypothetical protein
MDACIIARVRAGLSKLLRSQSNSQPPTSNSQYLVGSWELGVGSWKLVVAEPETRIAAFEIDTRLVWRASAAAASGGQPASTSRVFGLDVELQFIAEIAVDISPPDGQIPIRSSKRHHRPSSGLSTGTAPIVNTRELLLGGHRVFACVEDGGERPPRKQRTPRAHRKKADTSERCQHPEITALGFCVVAALSR